jgi:TonB family protein
MRNNSHDPKVQRNVLALIVVLLFVTASPLVAQSARQTKRDTDVRSTSPNGDCPSTSGLNRSLKKLGRKAPKASGCFVTVDLICAACRRGVEVNAPEPCYSGIAKSAKISGPVTVETVVNETGRVSWERVVKGHPLLRAAALAAALKRTFTPYTCSGRPIKAYDYVVYNFELGN